MKGDRDGLRDAIELIRREGGLWLPVEHDLDHYERQLRVMAMLQLRWGELSEDELDNIKAIADAAWNRRGMKKEQP